MVSDPPASASFAARRDLEAVARVQPPGRIVGGDAQADRAVAVGAGPAHDRAEQQAADALAAALGIHRDRELGHVVGDEAVAGRVRGRTGGTTRRRPARRGGRAPRSRRRRCDPSPRRSGGARVVEQLVERRSFLGAVVAPVDGLVEHLREEGRVGARAQAEHSGRLGARHAAAFGGRGVADVTPRVPLVRRAQRAGARVGALVAVVLAVRRCRCRAADVVRGPDRLAGLAPVRRRSSARRSRCRSTGRVPTAGRITLSLARRPADGRRHRRAVHESRRSRRLRASSSCSRPPTRSPARSSTGSTSCRGTRAASARARRPSADRQSRLLLRGRPQRAPTPRPRRANAAVAKRLVADCGRDERAGCSRTCRPRDGPRHGRDPRRDGRARRSTTSASRTAPTSARCTRTGTRRTCRAMVLDGAVDPAASYADGDDRPGSGFEHILDAFFACCRDNNDVRVRARRQPDRGVRRSDDVDRERDRSRQPCTASTATLGPGEANIGVATALYSGQGRAAGTRSAPRSNNAARGDGAALLALSDAYTGRHTGGTYDNETAAFYAIGCLDGPAPPTLAAVRAAGAARGAGRAALRRVDGLARVAVHVLAGARRRAGPAPIHAPGAPPIVVVGTTDDPATPYARAQALARELRVGPPAHLRRREPHRVRPRRRVRRQGRRPLPALARRARVPGTRCD